ncbi:MAG: hypothetical protein WCL42_10525 [Chlorobiaceae bacterium]
MLLDRKIDRHVRVNEQLSPVLAGVMCLVHQVAGVAEREPSCSS